MKLKNLLLLTMAGLFLSFITACSTQDFKRNLEEVGTIKQSLLKPTVFNATHKGVWVLLNGQELTTKTELFQILKKNSELNILTQRDGKYYLPNALGTFIRCSNYDGNGEDPDKTRLVGSFQNEEFKSHTHDYQSSATKSVSGSGSKSPFAWDPAGYTTGATGGVETRPKNISMFTYIKVSK